MLGGVAGFWQLTLDSSFVLIVDIGHDCILKDKVSGAWSHLSTAYDKRPLCYIAYSTARPGMSQHVLELDVTDTLLPKLKASMHRLTLTLD